MDNFFKTAIQEIKDKRNIKQVGECLKCGKCCASGVHNYTLLSIESHEGTEWKIKFNGCDKRVCDSYDKEKKICKDYNKRETICSEYPYLPEFLIEGCGCKFVNIV